MRTESASLAEGAVLSRYRIEGFIGAGGMGEVYVATDTHLGRRVAIKVLPRRSADDAERVRRFIREAEAASALAHPAIVTVHDSGAVEIDGATVHFLAMELIDGQTLGDWNRGSQPLRRKLEVLAGIADGLARAHSEGIVHRDLKPDNIMVARGGYPKILDFGVAKLTERGAISSEAATDSYAVLGTPAYMSPEQVSGSAVDARSDVFSFGCVMYELLLGHPPFRRETLVETMHAILHDEPAAIATLPRDLERIVRRCLAKDPEERFHSMRDVALDLREPLREQPAPESRRRWPLIVAASIIAAIAALAAFVTLRPDDDRRAALSSAAVRQPPTVRNATNSGRVVDGTISRDGRNLIYATTDGTKQKLWNRQLATGSDVVIRPPEPVVYREFRFSADGDTIYYSSAPQSNVDVVDLWQMPSLGGASRKVAADTEAHFDVSPNGRTVAFRRLSALDGIYHITVADIESGKERIVLSSQPPARIGRVGWSPDGRRIAYIAHEMTNGKLRLHLREVEVATGRVTGADLIRKWTTTAAFQDVTAFAWLRDSSGILMAASASTDQPEQLWFVPAGDGEPRRLTSDLGAYLCLSVTADGKTVAAHRVEGTANIWKASLADGSAEVLIPGTGVRHGMQGLRYLRDGRLLYTSFRPDGWYVEIADATGKRIESRRDMVWHPSVSPDEAWLAYASRKSGALEIWRSRLDGSEARQLTNLARAGYPSFFPDSRRIAFIAYTKGQRVMVTSMDGGEPQVLVDRPANVPEVSPDGKSLLCSYRSVPGEADSLWTQAIVPLDGRGKTRLYADKGNLRRWLPDGSGFVHAKRGGDANLWLQPLAGGQPKQITNFQSGVIYAFAISSDGRTAAISRGEPAADIILLRNFAD